MKPLGSLLDGVPAPWQALPISGIAVDSRAVKPGNLFVAVKGAHHDGHRFAEEVALSGAAAILAEQPLSASIPVVRVPSTGAALSELAARFYDHPSRSMDVVGITGTNGKTTITYLLESIWRTEGTAGGVLGTVDYRWPNHMEKAVNTTPHALDVQRLLAAMRSDGVTRAAMEVSSHALSLGRVEDVVFAVGLFTNLTQDHLDFHGDMEGYFRAKARLFELLARSPRPPRRAVVNLDDSWAKRFLETVRTPVWTYGVEGTADFRAEGLTLSGEGSRFRAVTPRGTREMHLALVGRHNVYNALGALAAAAALGTELDTAARGLEALAGVPGRLERVTEHPAGSRNPSEIPFGVFVDYAHTDDALRNVLETLRPLTRGRIIVLFGCGGDRDRTKRPKMGERAARLADHVIVTSDNPRSEDPQTIAREVEVGVRRVSGRSYDVVVERGEAIERALSLAKEGDVVLLAGKGHETVQIFGDRSVSFDDRAMARRLLAGRAGR
ncbi:MAG: UDP-N-acetylmuramoyl-L-alanyl-D-glutamate--2,6-diaminopimelate ligase [Elusimicrobia bacterium]|nr:UDP-N-acetylmuramoyl-L-alanyl-D-glutamate--2,6-diaminopimelate ligase [Elusimicrobiota bacterium]